MTNSRTPIPFDYAERFPRAFHVEHRLAQRADYEEMSKSRETGHYLLARQLREQLDSEAAVQLSHDTPPTSMDPPTAGSSDWYEQRNPHQTVRPSTQGVTKDQEVIDAEAYLALYAEADSDTPKAPQQHMDTLSGNPGTQEPKRRCKTSKLGGVIDHRHCSVSFLEDQCWRADRGVEQVKQ